MIFDPHKYDDIICLPHVQSKTRKHMSIRDRAAQFSSFSALTGYDDKVRETARITSDRIELDDYQKEELNKKLLFINDNIKNKPIVKITFFKKDELKDGGAYIKVTGAVSKLHQSKRVLIMSDKTEIAIDEIIEIDGEIFNMIDYDI